MFLTVCHRQFHIGCYSVFFNNFVDLVLLIIHLKLKSKTLQSLHVYFVSLLSFCSMHITHFLLACCLVLVGGFWSGKWDVVLCSLIETDQCFRGIFEHQLLSARLHGTTSQKTDIFQHHHILQYLQSYLHLQHCLKIQFPFQFTHFNHSIVSIIKFRCLLNICIKNIIPPQDTNQAANILFPTACSHDRFLTENFYERSWETNFCVHRLLPGLHSCTFGSIVRASKLCSEEQWIKYMIFIEKTELKK
jgi:hypothetical protein